MLLERVSAAEAPGAVGTSIHDARPAAIESATPYVVAAGLFGLAEILLHRVASPVSAHLPALAGSQRVVEWLDRAGNAVAAATAVLVAAAAVAAVIAVFRTRPVLGAALATTAAVTAFAVVAGTTTGATAGRLALLVTVGAAAATAVAALQRGRTLGAIAVLAACTAVAAGIWTLVAADFGFGAGPIRQVAEAALVAVPLALFVAVRHSPGWSRAGAVVGAAVATTLLVARPGDGALVSMWAVGATMALPTIAYLTAAAAAGAVIGRALIHPRARLPAAALALLTVAGIQNPALHHNLTAALALTALAVWCTRSIPEEEACPDSRVASS